MKQTFSMIENCVITVDTDAGTADVQARRMPGKHKTLGDKPILYTAQFTGLDKLSTAQLMAGTVQHLQISAVVKTPREAGLEAGKRHFQHPINPQLYLTRIAGVGTQTVTPAKISAAVKSGKMTAAQLRAILAELEASETDAAE